MTALWISLAALVALLMVWRLRRATKTLNRILREERDRPTPIPTSEQDTPADHPNH